MRQAPVVTGAKSLYEILLQKKQVKLQESKGRLDSSCFRGASLQVGVQMQHEVHLQRLAPYVFYTY